jgi:tetratricopeptide (TPR) repeat protein
MRTTKLGPDHPDTLFSRSTLAQDYWDLGRTAEAIPLFEETLRLRSNRLGPDHRDTLVTRNDLAVAYLATGRTAEAIALHEETLRLRSTKHGVSHRLTLVSRENLAAAYRAAGRTDEAIALDEQTLRMRESNLGSDHPDTLKSRNSLATAYEAAGLHAKSEAILRLCLAVRERVQRDDWITWNTRSQLGGSLLGQKKYAEAEPLILQGYEGIKARAGEIPAPVRSRLPEAAERVVRLYTKWGKPDQADAWKAKLGLAELPANPLSSGATGQGTDRCPKSPICRHR